MDLRQIDASHIEWLLKLMREQDIFKRVVFDLGAGILNDLNFILPFDKVFVPMLNNSYSKNKVDFFKMLVSDKKYSGLEKKIKYVEVPKASFDSRIMKDFILRDGM